VTLADERTTHELQIRALCESGDKQRAATLLLEAYGREVLGFVMSRLRDRDAADEVFSRFTEDLWRGLDGFRWQCSARVWAYTLARHAASRHLRDARVRRVHDRPLSHAGPISQVAERIRTATLASARSESKSQLARLRERLPADAQTLLILRVNRGLAWPEIAQVMLHEGEPVDGAVLEKEAVQLRKRYQRAKQKLRQMAADEGLLPVANDDEPT
jgi:RNA polymerase sigma-70 factor (ECF subfamily)